MPHDKPHYPDPDIHHGSFRVLPYTIGGYVLADMRREPGDQVIRDMKGKVMRWKTANEAGDVALAWHQQGHG